MSDTDMDRAPTQTENARDRAKRHAAEKPEQYTYWEYPDGGWKLITDGGYVAASGEPEDDTDMDCSPTHTERDGLIECHGCGMVFDGCDGTRHNCERDQE